ncbi:DUF6858 family protein [Nitratifractor salsuginis]|uniref:Uncharacterized protein n=1 Tax=Nitratifractor salsuginis (strain DSM 16511 / JCM 12458 / E9I37-1) TaxID=749222 RepID=E6WXV2_NITSE|nr:hypothetical protein [Nitratifractor salsuginis]ADV46359.1 hypothetical protein Nitsa_1105 [Nitratifractor salsuginis DSM 16511]
MKSMTIKDTYPIQAAEIGKDEAKFSNTDEIIAYLKEAIEAHPVATYIATFDHYTHTKNLPDHKMDEKIKDVKLIVFCFGKELPIPQMAAVRPRSIAVVEEDDKFTVSFMDAPNPQAHETMIAWVQGIRK